MYSDTKIIDTDIYIQVYKHRFTDVDIDICDKQKYKDNMYRYTLQLTLFRVGGGPNQPPMSRMCVYACEYAYTGANFL